MELLTQSADYKKFLNDVTRNIINAIPDSSNQKLWVKMGEALEMNNVPKEQISTIMRKDIEQILYEKIYYEFGSREKYKWHNNTYWLVTKRHGWTDPSMARHTLDPDRIKKTVPHTNHDMTVLCYDIINLTKMLISKSRENVSLEDVFGEKDMREFYRQQHTAVNNCKNAIDHKTKVPRNTELFLLECLSTINKSVNKCAEIFMEQNLLRLKEQGKFLTVKQATKFQKGMRQSRQSILKPPTRDMALYSDYSGIQCMCGSWRVRTKNETFELECYDCDKTMPRGFIPLCSRCKNPLFRERLLHIVKTGKCKNCNEIIDLPEELTEYAKST